MLFQLTEALCEVGPSDGQRVEDLAGTIYSKRGYKTIHHDYYLFHHSAKTKFPENEAVLSSVIGEDRLREFRTLSKTLYPEGLGKGLRPEQPDLFVYNDAGEFFFCEVKSKSDHLRSPQMIGISLIHCFLCVRTELCVILRGAAPARAKTYQWVWPGLQQVGFGKIVVA